MAQLDLSRPELALCILPAELTLLQLPPDKAVPRAIIEALLVPPSPSNQSIISLTRTPTETSLILPKSVCDSLVEAHNLSTEALPSSGPWLALKVRGPMDLSWTGILHALTGPLKEAQVPVFASSTYDTDYVLINRHKRNEARTALEAAGWRFET